MFFRERSGQCKKIRTPNLQKQNTSISHIPSICRYMATTHSYFKSPFLDEAGREEEPPWRPAFPDEYQEDHTFQGYDQNQQKSECIFVEDPPDMMTVFSYDCEQGKKSKPPQDKELQELIQEIDLSEEVELEDLQNIDINIQPQIYKKPSHESQDIEEVFFKQPVEGQSILSGKKYVGNSRDEEWMRRLDKTIAAKAFVYRGYGINYLKDQLRSGNYDKLILDDSKYKSISGSIAREGYRKLESFLLRDCKRKLHSLSGYEMKLLQTLLLNCRSTLPRFASHSFIQIIKITYTLEDSQLTESQAIALYQAIYRALQRKIAILRGATSERSSEQRTKRSILYTKSRPSDTTHISTPNLEREVIKEYLNEQSISKIRDNLRAKRLLDEEDGVNTIRNIMRRVLRSTIRKVEGELNQSADDLKVPGRLGDEQIKWIIESTEGIEVRRQLCRIHLLQRNQRKLFQTVYRDLKSFVQKKDNFGLSFVKRGRSFD